MITVIDMNKFKPSIAGEQHRKQRKMLNPVFSIAHLRGMSEYLHISAVSLFRPSAFQYQYSILLPVKFASFKVTLCRRHANLLNSYGMSLQTKSRTDLKRYAILLFTGYNALNCSTYRLNYHPGWRGLLWNWLAKVALVIHSTTSRRIPFRLPMLYQSNNTCACAFR